MSKGHAERYAQKMNSIELPMHIYHNVIVPNFQRFCKRKTDEKGVFARKRKIHFFDFQISCMRNQQVQFLRS